ncbi:T9SS type A sorting domain-containing protein [Polluticoccus soli]|uniref:T9SS type A sorting domain-containing protein n=1 Tax=Polluticoccus soli TaxID=3034150 RepID=UPI0023E0DAA6|nr:T9SS type A sorting domain-containing protein [Flavipsychrobacter sp. JY13-12]
MRSFIKSKKIAGVLLALGISSAAIAAPLSGTYTIGGTTPNYATLSDAVTALNTEGVSGPVTFNIRNGVYNATTWRAEIKTITGASATKRITFKSETNNAANVTIRVDGTASTANYVVKLNAASYITIKDLTFRNEGATYGRAIEIAGTSGNDSLINCRFESITRTASSTNTALVYGTSIKGDNNVFIGNTFLNNSYGLYYYGTSTTTKVANTRFLKNTFTNQYAYAINTEYHDNLRINGNTITTNSTGTFYGMEVYYADGASEIIGNTISGYSNGYGIMHYYSDGDATNYGLIANNVIYNIGGTGTSRGISSHYTSYQRYYNNTIRMAGTSATTSLAGYFYYSNNTDYVGNEIRNNVFSNFGGGYAIYVYNPSYNNSFDYNNLYTTGTKLVDQGTPSTDYAKLTDWRAAFKHDMNSISYDPAFTSPTNLTPDAGSVSSWSLNGRGIHLAGNNKDFNGNTRVTTLAAGVPDIGAFEFTPTSTPPAATAAPAVPAAGTNQVFTFGEDTVATINWAAASTVPAAITVRQYTGTLPAGINTISPTSMYFYTDITAPGTYNYSADIYYKEPWAGTTAAEVGLHLAKKEGANPWVGYAPAVSSAIPARDLITTSGLTDFGLFTGIDVADNAGTAGILGLPNYFCAGTYPVQVKVKNGGNNILNKVQIQWEIDGVAQPVINYATPIAVKGEANVTLGNVTFNNGYRNIKAWTVLPNGVADVVAIDDTSSLKTRDGLSGVYTIGGTTPSYATVAEAVKDVNDFGICGAVTFNIRNGNYAGNIILNKIKGASATNRVTFQGENGASSVVNISYTAAAAADNYVFQLNGASYVTMKDLTFTSGSATQGRVLVYVDSTSYDSLLNCRLVGLPVTTSSSNIALFYGTDITGKNNVFVGNTFQNGSYSLYYAGTSSAALTENAVFDRNSFENFYAYGAYTYYIKDNKFTNNNISTSSTYTSAYGAYIGYCDNALEVTRNKVMGLAGGYGLYIYYSDATATTRGLIANNTIAIGSGTASAYGLRIYYSSYQNVYNNSVNIISGSATTSYAGYIYSTSTTTTNNDIRNNVFANQGPGYALYVYNPTYNTSDYNNLFTNGVNLVDRGTPAADFTTLQAWRTASGQELNSIAYDPGYMSTTDLHPDPTKPASWSLNGRGVHAAFNNLDMDNNARITNIADGAPDLGAYEFTPTSVPPVAEATPAAPAPGTRQVFTFGQDTVAVIDWKPNSVMPNFIEMRQYSGQKAPQYTTPGYMYFHADVNTQSVTHNFDATIYYKDIWTGTIATESNLRMMKKLGSNPWTAYNGTESSVNTARNTINAPQLSSFGVFTGGNDGEIFSANIKPATTTVFCPGGNVTLNANIGTGYSYQWELNGSPIPGATSSTLVATTAGDYTVTITDNVKNKTATSDKVAITIISAPAAQVTASGALTYCPGSSLSLSTPAVSGVTYQWQLNGTNIAGATAATYQVAGAGQYTVQVNNTACSALSPIVNVTAGPLQLSIGNDTTFCESPTAMLVLDAGHAGANYTWNTGAATQQIAATTTGKYWVTVDAGAGCVATDTIQVTVNPLPSVSGISYNRAGNTFQFSANGVKNANSYLWIFNDGVNSNAQAPSHTFTIQPTEVVLILTNDCGTDTIKLNLNATNVNDVNKDELTLNLYPNPASDKITLQVDGTFTLENIAVVNQLGQVVMKEELNGGVKTKTIDVSNLPVGYYILRAGTSDGVIAKPFNITR